MFRKVMGVALVCLVGVGLACGTSAPASTGTQPTLPANTPAPTITRAPTVTPLPGGPIDPAVPATGKVTGTVSYRERIALTPDAILEVKLVDVSRADAPAVTIGEQVTQNPGQVPIDFEIEYNTSEIDERLTYAVQARIMEGDRLMFINDTAYHVITQGNPSQVDLVLVVVSVGPPSGPGPSAFRLDACSLTRAAQLPIDFEYQGTVPTGFDGINRANCSFTKAVKTVTVTLTGPATHSEIFTLAEPGTDVPFPLPDGTPSITTFEIVPPGEYQREMTATSVDGESLVISDLNRVLKTVTIIESINEETTAEFTFEFDADAQGWIAGFADLPVNFEPAIYELDSGYRPLPGDLEGSGVYLQGHNRSDDLFMFLKRQVEGLRPDTFYTVTVSLDLATNVPAGLVGIGGAPGEGVFVKAGASVVEPLVVEDDDAHLRMNIEKGNQATDGEAMINIGDVAHPDVTGEEYRIKTLDNQERPLQVISDSEGRIWLIVGTDSGFEGLTAIYYARIAYTLTSN